VGVAELDEAGAFGVHRHGAVDGDRPKLIGLALGGSQRGRPLMLNAGGRRLGDCLARFNKISRGLCHRRPPGGSRGLQKGGIAWAETLLSHRKGGCGETRQLDYNLSHNVI
jgi:hypothetical protein